MFPCQMDLPPMELEDGDADGEGEEKEGVYVVWKK